MDQYQEQSLKAYKKAYFHSLKYVTEDVFGLIVGRMEIDNKLILDAFPLSHTRILSPTLEIAFEIIEAFIKKSDLKIIGLYSAILDDQKIDSVSELEFKILEKISESIQSEPLLLKITDAQLEQEVDKKSNTDIDQEEELTLSSCVFQILFIQNIKLFRVQKKGSDDFSLKKLHDLDLGNVYFDKMKADIQNGVYRQIVDFDSHFEDFRLDLSNQFVK